MASCAYCGSMIFFGGVKDGDLRYCDDDCAQSAYLDQIASQIPQALVAEHTESVHKGPCPVCEGEGPVDVHTSHRVYSLILVTSHSSRSKICCKSCGTKQKIGDLFFSLFLGWWGIPWGILMTPIQVGKNLIGLFSSPNPNTPSQKLEERIRLHMASQIAENSAAAGAE